MLRLHDVIRHVESVPAGSLGGVGGRQHVFGLQEAGVTEELHHDPLIVPPVD